MVTPMPGSHPRIWEHEPELAHQKLEAKNKANTGPVARFVRRDTSPGAGPRDTVLAGANGIPLGIYIERPNPKDENSSEFDDYAVDEKAWVLMRCVKPVLVETEATEAKWGTHWRSGANGLAVAAANNEAGYLVAIEHITYTKGDTTKRFVRGLLTLPAAAELAGVS